MRGLLGGGRELLACVKVKKILGEKKVWVFHHQVKRSSREILISWKNSFIQKKSLGKLRFFTGPVWLKIGNFDFMEQWDAKIHSFRIWVKFFWFRAFYLLACAKVKKNWVKKKFGIFVEEGFFTVKWKEAAGKFWFHGKIHSFRIRVTFFAYISTLCSLDFRWKKFWVKKAWVKKDWINKSLDF